MHTEIIAFNYGVPLHLYHSIRGYFACRDDELLRFGLNSNSGQMMLLAFYSHSSTVSQ
jgi:hypothetical protein